MPRRVVRTRTKKSGRFRDVRCFLDRDTLQGINISHPGEKEHHLQNAILGGYVNFLEGISLHHFWC